MAENEVYEAIVMIFHVVMLWHYIGNGALCNVQYY